MNTFLSKHHYLYIPQFISPKKTFILSEEFRIADEQGLFQPDETAPNSSATYNFIPFLELLTEKTNHVSSLVEERVIPTYCYARIYKEGSVLKKHTDRPACEISLTVHLDGDKDWDIFIETSNKIQKPISLRKGDAMLYLGCNTPHWREPFSGKYYSQVFLHYVMSEGKNSKHYFDNNNYKEN
jgi:hypothetical protein